MGKKIFTTSIETEVLEEFNMACALIIVKKNQVLEDMMKNFISETEKKCNVNIKEMVKKGSER